eukprot:scaffold224254_cov47-Attheya_sp.AAC.1
MEFATAAMQTTKVGASKSGSQSDVGAMTRRTRLGSERVYLDQSGVPKSTDGWFGNPTIRAVSKICSSIL